MAVPAPVLVLPTVVAEPVALLDRRLPFLTDKTPDPLLPTTTDMLVQVEPSWTVTVPDVVAAP